jgi:DNA-binding response OmpR family regulator
MSSDNGSNSPSSAETITKPTTRSLTPSGVNNRRILIVDDEEDIAWCFKISLECAGFIVDVFNDPMKSLSAYRAGVYDLLLLDIRMPRMSGFELYDRIKEIDDRVNVCFVTAYEEYYDEIKKRFPHSEKAEWFIRKPIGIEELVKKVKSKLNC